MVISCIAKMSSRLTLFEEVFQITKCQVEPAESSSLLREYKILNKKKNPTVTTCIDTLSFASLDLSGSSPLLKSPQALEKH